MKPITPREFDPGRVGPDANAEVISGLSFLLELPHCLRVDHVIFLISARGGSWRGWNPDAIGRMVRMSAPVPEDDLWPRYRVEITQTRVDGWVPLAAAQQAFPDWEKVEPPPKEGPPPPSARGAQELRSVVQLTIYEPVADTPIGQVRPDTERLQHDAAEWLSRRLDEALAFLNQYLVLLGAMHDEWHISSLSRIDLPRDTPWKLDLSPCPDGWTGPTGWVDAHTGIRDDLPEERSQDEVLAAVDAVNRARAGNAPFFQFIELYQAAEHHLGSGRQDQSVISACTATEVLVNTLFRVLWICLERGPESLPGVLRAPFRNQLTELLPKFLEDGVDLTDESLPPGRWYSDCYMLRNKIVHEGWKATAPQAYDCKVATSQFARWIGEKLSPDARTDWVKATLRFGDPA